MVPRPRQIARRLLRRVVRPIVERRLQLMEETEGLREDVERLEQRLSELTELVGRLGSHLEGDDR